MKELDFLPQWYRADRIRKQRRRRYCVLFGLMAGLVGFWSFIAGQSVGGLKAQTQEMAAALEQGQQVIQTAMEMDAQIALLSRQAEMLASLTPRTTVSAALGELSALACENVVFSRVTLTLEPIAEAVKPAADSAGVVRLAAKSDAASPLPAAPQRMRVTLTGIAAGGAEVARLIESLERSAYFENVAPSFSRSKKINDRVATEFEITCTVADYTVQK